MALKKIRIKFADKYIRIFGVCPSCHFNTFLDVAKNDNYFVLFSSSFPFKNFDRLS